MSEFILLDYYFFKTWRVEGVQKECTLSSYFTYDKTGACDFLSILL